MNEIQKIGSELLMQGESIVIAKVVDTQGSTPRKKGALLLMQKNGSRYGTVGGGKLEAEVEKIALKTFETKESKIYSFALKPEDQKGIDMRCGGDANISIEYIDERNKDTFQKEFPREDTAYIYGGGHIGKALAPVLNHIGFSTIILDDRGEFACEERFPDAERIHVLKDFSDCFAGLSIDENSYIIIVTRGHSGDYDVLKQALKQNAYYIGMIGSKKKIAVTYEQLKAEGFTQQQLEQVHAPIGLSIGAETPEEIAISIAAEMISVRSGK